MRPTTIIVLLVVLRLVGESAELPPLGSGIHFRRTNLVVNWKAPTAPWPRTLWVYRVIPMYFSPTVISNVMSICSVTEKDKKDYGTNGMVFSPPGGSRNLRISFPEGSVEYWSTRAYGRTEMAKDVPGTNKLFLLTAAILSKLGINLSEIAKRINTDEPKLSFFESAMVYSFDHQFTTNVEWRSVRFNRALDGVEFGGDGGNCEIQFGDHAQVTKLWLSWRNVERQKSYIAATPEVIMQWLREGKAIQEPAVDEFGNELRIDWSTVKSLTITRADPYYWGQVYSSRNRPSFPCSLVPYAALLATVDTGPRKVDVAIECPILAESLTNEVKNR
jgi:hypothetical protein